MLLISENLNSLCDLCTNSYPGERVEQLWRRVTPLKIGCTNTELTFQTLSPGTVLLPFGETKLESYCGRETVGSKKLCASKSVVKQFCYYLSNNYLNIHLENSLKLVWTLSGSVPFSNK